MVYMIALSIVAGVLALYYLFFKDLNYFKKHGIPYVKPLPLLGNMAPVFLRRITMADLVKNCYDVHPDAKYVGIYDLTQPLILIRDPELLKSVTLKHFDMFPDHRNFMEDPEKQDPLFGKNLFSLRGDRWRNVRSVLSPAFTTSKMRGMFKLMSNCATEFTDSIAQLSKEQRTIDTKDAFTRYTNDVIATCAFGISVNSMTDRKNQFYVYGREATTFSGIVIFKVYLMRSLPKLARLLRLTVIRKKVGKFFQDLVETTIKARDEEGIVRPDMLQLMMENRKEGKIELTIEDMVAQAFIFFFGGFESTATLMCFAAHEIAMNPDVQERLQNEIDHVLEETNGEASYEAVNAMEYLEAVIYEALRMYPVAVMVDRVCQKDFELPPTLPGSKPVIVRKGEYLAIPIYPIQRDPKYFDEPDKFNAERFLGDHKREVLNNGAYIPFGLGPRMCIGNRFALLETKVLLFHLLARCDLKPSAKMILPIRIAKDNFNMAAEGGFWLDVTPRKNAHRSVTVNVTNGIH